MDRSDDMSQLGGQPNHKPNINKALHKVVQMKVKRMITRKQSDPGYLLGDDGNIEMNNLDTIKNKDYNYHQQLLSKNERLRNQMLDPEMSKSYSFAKNNNGF